MVAICGAEKEGDPSPSAGRRRRRKPAVREVMGRIPEKKRLKSRHGHSADRVWTWSGPPFRDG